MIEAITASAIIFGFIGFCIYTQLPPDWQTPLGLAICCIGWAPAGLLLLALLKLPAVMIPAVFLLGIAVTRTRSS